MVFSLRSEHFCKEMYMGLDLKLLETNLRDNRSTIFIIITLDTPTVWLKFGSNSMDHFFPLEHPTQMYRGLLL